MRGVYPRYLSCLLTRSFKVEINHIQKPGESAFSPYRRQRDHVSFFAFFFALLNPYCRLISICSLWRRGKYKKLFPVVEDKSFRVICVVFVFVGVIRFAGAKNFLFFTPDDNNRTLLPSSSNNNHPFPSIRPLKKMTPHILSPFSFSAATFQTKISTFFTFQLSDGVFYTGCS